MRPAHVRVDEPPFHLTSDALRLRRVPIGVELDGEGKLAFCPCLGAPLAVRFTGATVAPPHDVILRNPVLEVFGVPRGVGAGVLAAVAGPARPPPARSSPGAGPTASSSARGVHVPWRQGRLVHGLDLRAGGVRRRRRGGRRRRCARRRPRRTCAWDDLHGDAGSPSRRTGRRRSRTGIARTRGWDVDALRGRAPSRRRPTSTPRPSPSIAPTAQAAWRAGRVGDRLAAFAPSRFAVATVLDDGVGRSRRRRPPRRRARGVRGLRRDARGRRRSPAAGFGADELRARRGRRARRDAARRAGRVARARGLGDVADDGVREGVDGVAQARAAVTLAAGARVRVGGRRRSVGAPHRAAARGGRPGRGAHRRRARRSPPVGGA